MGGAEGSTLRGYRGIGDITFDLNGTPTTDIGWVLFEVNDDQLDRGRGIVGTFNNYATLRLIRSTRTKTPCRIYGLFDDGKTRSNTWLLDDVVFTGMLVRDASGILGFRAGAVTCVNEPQRR